jgi:hypothetical protein
VRANVRRFIAFMTIAPARRGGIEGGSAEVPRCA